MPTGKGSLFNQCYFVLSSPQSQPVDPSHKINWNVTKCLRPLLPPALPYPHHTHPAATLLHFSSQDPPALPWSHPISIQPVLKHTPKETHEITPTLIHNWSQTSPSIFLRNKLYVLCSSTSILPVMPVKAVKGKILKEKNSKDPPWWTTEKEETRLLLL